MTITVNPFAGFEFFESVRPRPQKQAGNVNINTKGTLSIAPDLCEHLVPHKDNKELEDKGWVRVGVKRDTREVLVIPSIEQEDGALRIACPKGQRYIVNAGRVLRAADMIPSNKVSSRGRWQDFGARSGLIFTIPKD